MKKIGAIIFLVALGSPGLAAAQLRSEHFAADTSREPSRLVIRVGKWATAAAAAGAVGAGIVWNREADRRYEDLERLCTDQPARCNPRTADGAFRDGDFEQEYQDIVRLDDRARLALVAGQVAVATSVILFILDLPRDAGARDKPYTPPKLQVLPAGAGVEVRYRVR